MQLLFVGIICSHKSGVYHSDIPMPNHSKNRSFFSYLISWKWSLLFHNLSTKTALMNITIRTWSDGQTAYECEFCQNHLILCIHLCHQFSISSFIIAFTSNGNSNECFHLNLCRKFVYFLFLIITSWVVQNICSEHLNTVERFPQFKE